MENNFVCPRCGNSDPRFLGVKNGSLYCRKCIQFQGEEAKNVILRNPRAIGLELSYPLSKEQQVLSDRIVSNFKQGKDTLVYAVCGSGKTEISYGVIGYAMSRGMKVGFALPRRDVVIELFFRLKEAFPSGKIVAVYGGHRSRLEGDCIVLTTHQLYRYPNYFDLLVMDEIDAFPFKGNEVLTSLYKKSLKGHCVMMSATPSKEIVAEFKGDGKEMLTLHTRFHRHPIPVPESKKLFGFFALVFLMKKLKEFQKRNKPCFVFVPKVRYTSSVFSVLSPFFPRGNYVSSQRENREKIIQDFKEGKYDYLITTAVLERGITVANLQVVVLHADDPIYNSAALIQIAGRAGRKASAPTGEVYFIGERITKSMEDAINEIRYCNTFL